MWRSRTSTEGRSARAFRNASDGHLVVRAEVPGFKPEEIDIEAEGGVLTISGKHEATSEEKDKEFVRRERCYGAFSRTMPLPEGVDPKKIKATTTDGVLELTIPLPKEAAAEPVKITPTAAGWSTAARPQLRRRHGSRRPRGRGSTTPACSPLPRRPC